MRAGALSKRVEIQSRTITQDGFGDGLETWTTAATRWASLENPGSREPWQAQAVSADADAIITMRYYDGLTNEYRLKIGSRIFNIESVSTDEIETVCVCKEV